MKAQELRIGNLINDKVTSVKGQVSWEILRIIEDKENHTYEPIPLTEEWLVKFGLTSVTNHGTLFTNYWNKECDCSVDIVNNEVFEYRLNGRKRTLSLMYVHQLQNLYFALTNKELTV